jgi:hypothetical protein
MEFLKLKENNCLFAPQAKLLYEAGYEFVRFPCKSGFIDHHKSNGFYAPFNIDWKRPESYWRFYRLNGDVWTIEWNFNDGFLKALGRFERKDYTAKEIWNKYLIRTTITPINNS